MTTSFLDPEEIREFTGRAHKALQIKALAQMGVPFWINAIGRPIVSRTVIEGRSAAKPVKKEWVPDVLKTG